MSHVTRSLRVVRRELDSLHKVCPPTQLEFDSAQNRNEYLDQLQDYHEQLTRQLASFKEVQREYFALRWTTPADQADADKQAEQDMELLVVVDRILSEVASTIRKLTGRLNEEKDQLKAAAERKTVMDAQVATLETLRGTQQKAPVTKLPKLSFPAFDGNLLQWPSFWDRFKVSIHENATLSDVDKLSFLVGQLTGEAAQAIAGLSITAANYNVALGLLEERYGNIDQIINAHYTSLSDLSKAHQAKDLRSVVDQLEQHLNALQALGEDTNHRHFYTLIMSKLPPSDLG